MIDYITATVSEMDPLQIVILVISLFMIFIGGKKIISQGFFLLFWLIVSLIGTVGVIYTLNPPLFNNLKTQIESSDLNLDGINPKHLKNPF